MPFIDFSMYDSSKPIREITYEALKDAIISGDITPGERIIESEYAGKFNISRTPVREALRKLEQDGLVEYIPRKGVIVKSLDQEDIAEVYTIRLALESLALQSAVKNADEASISLLYQLLDETDACVARGDIVTATRLSREFHNKLCTLSGMKRLVDMVNTLNEFIDRFSYISMTVEERRMDVTKEHRRLVDLLRDRNAPALLELCKTHLESSRDNCIKTYLKHRDEAALAKL